MSYTLVTQPCSPYPRPTMADLDAAPIGDRSVDRRARWLLDIVGRLSRADLEEMALALSALDQRAFEQELARRSYWSNL